MFMIKKVADDRLAQRICGSFYLSGENTFAYGAFSGEDVLATAAFSQKDKCVVLEGADTGRRLDIGLVDGMARAAFNAQKNQGAVYGKLGENLGREIAMALSKLGYEIGKEFELGAFFSKRNCVK
ncbi:hypothetical protein [Youxingia wuxianensis]|uniref:Uncharacterized protein n=1 Tax=Youxingia wuxianensis TaxID=2763678 RepID=A0A926EN94_9FIRM|nr:hypothetical protein [Youxingia wuxianensis]MBC8585731.1 hypothetical protein [Youxingia wuxianensis]